MKHKLTVLVALLVALIGVFAFFPKTAEAATAPTKVWVAPSETNGIPAEIDVFPKRVGGTDRNPIYTYELYLPGNADISACYFTWDGDMQLRVDGVSYTSGTCPVAPANVSKTYYLMDGNRTYASFTAVTYQGSASVTPVFIEIDESEGNPTIAQMDSDPYHEVTCSGTIYIDGTQYELTKMKGRGNATWRNGTDKLPYNITLGKKINWPGIDSDKTKKWSLLAESFDHSLLANRTGYDLAYEMGIGLDTDSADVWMNGEYQGCYTITPKYDSFVTKDGFMIENDNYYEEFSVEDGGNPQFHLAGNVQDASGVGPLITVKQIGDNLLTNDAGEVDESAENLIAVSTDIAIWLQEAWEAILSDTGYNSQGRYYTEYIDLESFAKMYLMLEYAKGYDVCGGSNLMYRDGTGEDDKLYAGPLWDLDNGMGSTSQNDTLGAADDRVNGDRRSGEGDFIPNITDNRVSIYKTLLKHGDFVAEVFRQYNLYRDSFNNLTATLEELIREIEASGYMNHAKVIEPDPDNHRYYSDTALGSGKYYQYYYATTDQSTTWYNSAANLRTFVIARSAWFNERYTAFETGWTSYAGKYYYFEDYTPVESVWVWYGGDWLYIKDYTVMFNGVVEYNDRYLFIDNYRVVKDGWMYYNGSYLYIKDYSPMQEGWVKYNGQYYYIRNYFPVANDWVKYNGTYYYMTGSGTPAVNTWIRYNGTWYHFNSSGVVDRTVAA